MKKLIFIVVLIILFRPVFPVLSYVVDYKYVSTVLCENISKPELGCNGKCHLKKELANVSKDNKTKSNEHNNNNNFQFEILFCEQLISFDFSNAFFKEKEAITYYSCIYFQKNSTSIFHPPILV